MSKKKAKIKDSPNKKRLPRVHRDAERKKNAALSSAPESITHKKPIWKLGFLDLNCSWGFTTQGSKEDFVRVIEKLKNFEKQTWGEIDRNKKNNHSSPISGMSYAARKRLNDLNIDARDQVVLYSLRLTGKERIWGIREGSEFYFLWWDPEHVVYPSQLKHT